jgi:hypothetical protein
LLFFSKDSFYRGKQNSDFNSSQKLDFFLIIFKQRFRGGKNIREKNIWVPRKSFEFENNTSFD